MSVDGVTERNTTGTSGSIGSTSPGAAKGQRVGMVGEIRSVGEATVTTLRVLILAGIPTGVVVVGLGSRLAMFALRLTSSSAVDGIESDDGFIIGRFTLSGTYNLLMTGATVGVLGAAVYQWVRPWLIGPQWFRSFTLALAAGAVVGSMLVHADGIDFVLLDPMWFAVALFVALPAVFAVCVAWAVEYVEHREVPAGPRRWILPVLLPLLFPFSILVVVLAALITLGWKAVRQTEYLAGVASKPALAFVMRGFWLSIAVWGAFALFGDISDLRR